MKATFQNTDNALWPGLSVATRLLVNTRKKVVVVPNDAIQHGPNGLYVFVVGNADKAEMRDIKIGNEGAAQTIVVEGLAAGERVVVAGQYRLTQGATIDPHELIAPAPSVDKQAKNTSLKAP
jgi:multidrug efflux system membrane fusion protein